MDAHKALPFLKMNINARIVGREFKIVNLTLQLHVFMDIHMSLIKSNVYILVWWMTVQHVLKKWLKKGVNYVKIK